MDKETFLTTLRNKLVRYGCGSNDLERIYSKISSQVPESVETEGNMNDLVIQVLSAECHRFKTYDHLAVRFLDDHHQQSSPSSFLEVVEKIQSNRDVTGFLRPLLSQEFYDFIQNHRDLVEDTFQKVLHSSKPFPLSTFGWKTLFRSYLVKTHEGVVERPDHLWYRVALFFHRDQWDKVEKTFRSLRQGEYIHATPTLFSAGMSRPQMASCFSGSTRVLTMKGYVPIDQVQEGDLVLSHTFHWRKVLQTHRNMRMRRDMYRLSFYRKAPIEATLDHPFLKYNPDNKEFEWRNVSELSAGDWIAEGTGFQDTRFLDRHMIRGMLFGFRDLLRAGETFDTQLIRVRASKLRKVQDLLTKFYIQYELVDTETLRLLHIASWYPIHPFLHYVNIDKNAFDYFLRGLRWTQLYDKPTKTYRLIASQMSEVANVALIHGYKVVPTQGHYQLKKPVECTAWLGRRVYQGRYVVRLMGKTFLENAPSVVHTLGVDIDHSYIAEGVIVRNCFLVGMEDSVHGIYQTLADCAQISKWAGGLGIHISSIRGKNSYIYGTNGSSNGIVPMLKVFNDTARYIDQCFVGNTPVYTERGLVPIQDLVPFQDKVLTKGGTFEIVQKKLTFTLPQERLINVTVQTPLGNRETVVMSREHTVQWMNKNSERTMVPFEEAGFHWQTTYVPYQGNQMELPFTVEECFVLGFTYREMTAPQGPEDTLRYPLDFSHVDETKWHFFRSFFQTYYPDCVLWSSPYHLVMDLSLYKQRAHLPQPIDVSRLQTYPKEFQFLMPLEKAVAFQEGWNASAMGRQDQFWVHYRQNIKTLGLGNIVSVHSYEGPSRVVYDLEIENDKSYQTSIGVVHNGGGKRNGAFAMYLEPWHSDILEFLEAKKNVGSEEERARDLFYALWVPDLFMKYVSEGKDWYLMSPNQSPGLNKVWGKDFEKLYQQYIKDGHYIKKVPARTIWKEIMRSQIETGTPYMLYKDTCNRKSNQQNLGTIRSSNLCCEIIEYSDENEYAVCNLASISLPSCLKKEPLPSDPIWIFGKADCPFCLLLKGALSTRRVDYIYRDRKSDLSEEERARVVKGRTLPIVYIGGEYIGGFTEMWNLYLKPRFDFDKLGDITEQLVDNLNIVIDKNAYPLDKCEISNKKHRPIGIGVQGLADVLFEMLLPFDGAEARDLNQQIFECLYYHALKRSNELAQEAGPYSSFNGSPLSKGIFHFEFSKVTGTLHYDWDNLRTKIMENGTRNSLLVAPMPTASTSQILGNTESFEPLTSNLYLRRTTAGEFYVCNKMLRRVLEWLEMWNNETIENLIIFKGSVKSLSIPVFLKTVFRTVWEIPQKSLIDMAADRQQFIDQSQSFNIYLPDQDMEKLTKIHFYGWKKGLKTGSYYVRSRPPISSQNFTIDPLKEKETICESCSA